MDNQLQTYINKGIKDIMKDIIKTTFKDPAESIFMSKFAHAVQKANKIRDAYEENGEHIPPFLLASITSNCNLHCKGCYARENKICSDENVSDELSPEDWGNLFAQANDLGISFILLLGGEPLIRMEVIRKAAEYPDILFPVFTNGTIRNERVIEMFSKNRNLVPIISIEGNVEATDIRRGSGVYAHICETMDVMKKEHLLFGASITVTRENMEEVFADSFVEDLLSRGCRAILYIEYVPLEESTVPLAPRPEDNAIIEARVSELRKAYDRTLFISFPGDEHKSGGCLAAGRGFFHINVNGNAEPCPASPYSDCNVKEIGLRAALKSPLFYQLKTGGILAEDHLGGCVLYENKEIVENMIKK